jgi:hypothetical protein
MSMRAPRRGCPALDGVTGLRAANARLRQVTQAYLWHGQFLSRDRACAALGEIFGCAPSPGALAT